jgi:hypothetical protein
MKWNINGTKARVSILGRALRKEDEKEAPAPADKGGGGGSPPAPSPAPADKAEATKLPVPPTSKFLGDEDEIEARTTYEVTGSAFKKRIQRASSAQLREMFGTDDTDKITKDWKRFQDIEKKHEEERRAKLDNEQKLKEDNAKLQSQLTEVTQRAQALEEDRVVDSFVTRVGRIASKHIDGEYVDDIVWGAFKRHVASLSEKEQEGMKEKDIDAWFKDYAEKKPKFAREVSAEKKADEKPTEKKPVNGKPATNGIADNKRPTSGGSNPTEKTARPGQANSMSPTEYRQHKANVLAGK